MKEIKVNKELQTALEQIIVEEVLTGAENQKFLNLYANWLAKQRALGGDCRILFQVDKQLKDYAVVDKYGDTYNISIDKSLFNSKDVTNLAKALIFAGHAIIYAFQNAAEEKVAQMQNKKPARKRLVLGKTTKKLIKDKNLPVTAFVESFYENTETQKFVENLPCNLAQELATVLIQAVTKTTNNQNVAEYLEALANDVNKVCYAEYYLNYQPKLDNEKAKKQSIKVADVVTCYGV